MPFIILLFFILFHPGFGGFGIRGELTTAISRTSSSRCCSKAVGEADPRVLKLNAILGFYPSTPVTR